MAFKDTNKRREYCKLWVRRKRAKFPKKDQSLAHRTYRINQHVFDSIDSEIKAYLLGFLTADGCNKTDRDTVELTIAKKDIEIVELFKELLETNKPIKILKARKETHSDMANLSIYNKHLSEQLNKLGIVKNKSKYLNKVTIKNSLIKPFMRGYFDGDGHIGINKNNRFSFSICSNKIFCNYMAKLIKKELNINITITDRYKDGRDTSFSIVISGENQILKVLDWLYKDSTIKLNRKYEVYLKCKKIRNK